MKRALLLLFGLVGCFVTAEDREDALDRDHDGFIAEQAGGLDCNDSDDDVYPGAFESCIDDIDSDCDGNNCPLRADVDLESDDVLAWGGENGHGLQATTGVIDLAGDGIPELLLSGTFAREGDGAVYLYETPITGPLDPLLEAPSLGGLDGRGLRAWSAGDLDGDGDEEALLTTVQGPGGLWLVTDPFTDRGSVRDLGAALSVGDDRADGKSVQFGQVWALGDIDGDGLATWALGSPGTGDEEQGAVFVFEGPFEGDGEAADLADTTVVGRAPGDWLGADCGEAGDLDGDGLPELIVCAASSDTQATELDGEVEVIAPDAGAAYVFSSSSLTGGTLVADDADATVRSVFEGAPLMLAGSIGDTNGDEVGDLGVHFGGGAGDFFIFQGPLEGELYADSADLRLFGDAGVLTTAGFGQSFSAADVNDDGNSDVLIGAPAEGFGGLGDANAPYAGAAYLFLGPVLGVQSPDHATARWKGVFPEGALGMPLATDLDRDGALDLLMTAPFASPLPGDPGEENGAVMFVLDAFYGLSR